MAAMAEDTTPTTEDRAKVFAALADPTRLRLVELLVRHGELSGSELAERAGISLALTGHHRKILKEAGLIASRKVGQTTYCALDRGPLAAAVRDLIP